MRCILGLVGILGLAASGAAQSSRVELVPTLGYAWGGQMLVQERAFQFKDLDVDISSSGTYGLRLDVPVGQSLAVELLLQRQDTQLKDDQGLFGETPGGFVVPGSTHILDAEFTTAQLGFLWFVKHGPARWHLAAALGLTHANFLLPIPSDRVSSYSLGAGVQLELSEHLGIRFESRYLTANTDENLRSTYTFANPDCRDPCSYTFAYQDRFTQTWLSTGLAIRF
ncbi:MAG: outer membrane beta-barrel protein [Thermoanaerobaculaceae bacterium]|nr:outer membrane beta-barrel protein [Thermoanaerobaculaceae bacterium]